MTDKKKETGRKLKTVRYPVEEKHQDVRKRIK